MKPNTGPLHFSMALVAGLLLGFGFATVRYVLQQAYGMDVPREGPIAMTMAILTACAPLVILTRRDAFDRALNTDEPLLRNPVWLAWLISMAVWVGVVVFASWHAQDIQGQQWYERLPGALVLYAVPTLAWLFLNRIFLRLRLMLRDSDVRPA